MRGSPSRGINRGLLTFTRPVFPSPAPPGWNRQRFGFPPSFAPRRHRQRTSRAGTGHRARTWNYRSTHIRRSPIRWFTQCVRPRVARRIGGSIPGSATHLLAIDVALLSTAGIAVVSGSRAAVSSSVATTGASLLSRRETSRLHPFLALVCCAAAIAQTPAGRARSSLQRDHVLAVGVALPVSRGSRPDSSPADRGAHATRSSAIRTTRTDARGGDVNRFAGPLVWAKDWFVNSESRGRNVLRSLVRSVSPALLAFGATCFGQKGREAVSYGYRNKECPPARRRARRACRARQRRGGSARTPSAR